MNYPVRKCFIPRKDYKFVMFDYDQMEYRLMLDYAGELKVIEEIKNGMDVHEATGKLVGVSREEAKTLNFMLLYGGGVNKLAISLNVDIKKARSLKSKYFKKLPNVKKLIKRVNEVVQQRGHIKNWLGRRYYFKENFYKAPNYLIQGGCADIIKLAMLDIDWLLEPYKSSMLVTIHDEVLCEIHKDEDFLILQIRDIMEGIYKPRHLALSVGIEESEISWHDKEPYLHEAKDVDDLFEKIGV